MNKSTLAFSGLNALGLLVKSNSVVSQELKMNKLVRAKTESLFNFS